MSETRTLEPLLYTTEEAAALLSVGVTKTKTLIRTGDLRSIKVGSLRRILAASVHEYIQRKDVEQNGVKA